MRDSRFDQQRSTVRVCARVVYVWLISHQATAIGLSQYLCKAKLTPQNEAN